MPAVTNSTLNTTPIVLNNIMRAKSAAVLESHSYNQLYSKCQDV